MALKLYFLRAGVTTEAIRARTCADSVFKFFKKNSWLDLSTVYVSRIGFQDFVQGQLVPAIDLLARRENRLIWQQGRSPKLAEPNGRPRKASAPKQGKLGRKKIYFHGQEAGIYIVPQNDIEEAHNDSILLSRLREVREMNPDAPPPAAPYSFGCRVDSLILSRFLDRLSSK